MKAENSIIFHDLRRSFITNASKSVDSQVVMTMSGHKTREAFKRYRYIDDSDQVEAVKRMEAYYAEQIQKQDEQASEDSPGEVSSGA
jgi:integrase